jgi:hypothetical protein
MLGPLEFFNALVARIKDRAEGYCSVLDILVARGFEPRIAYQQFFGSRPQPSIGREGGRR